MDEGDLHPTDAAPPLSLGQTWPTPRLAWTDQDAAFVACIRDDPDDDTPRLIYADWLLDQDDPRGLFIHLDIACLDEKDTLRLRTILRDRRRLLQRYEECWSPARWVRAVGGFTRGFLDSVTMTPNQLISHGDAVFEREPIQELRLVYEPYRPIAGLYLCPCLGHVRRLRVETTDRLDWLVGLLNAPGLTAVHALTLRHPDGSPVSSREAIVLRRSPLLPRLRTLRLPGLDPGGLYALLATPGFAVERLEVPGSQRATDVVPAWDDESPAIVDVPSIDLAGLELLLEHPAAESLRYLDASYNPVSLVLDRLVRSENLRELSHIRTGPREEIDLKALRELVG